MMMVLLIMGLAFDKMRDIPALFVIFYGLTFFFANFGPNSTTFLLPVEHFPTRLRATGHGFCACMGKIGALVGTSIFTPIENKLGVKWTFVICGIFCLFGLFTTFLVPDDLKGDIE